MQATGLPRVSLRRPEHDLPGVVTQRCLIVRVVRPAAGRHAMPRKTTPPPAPPIGGPSTVLRSDATDVLDDDPDFGIGTSRDAALAERPWRPVGTGGAVLPVVAALVKQHLAAEASGPK